jgi:hypothetical protein
MLKALDNKVRSLCTPAFVYLVISGLAIVIMMLQNVNEPKNKYCVGLYECHLKNSTHKLALFVGKLIYLIFWTWMLNLMCNAGHKDIAWFFVLIPIVMMFVIITLLMTTLGGHLKI